MKKNIFWGFAAMAVLALGFTACDDKGESNTPTLGEADLPLSITTTVDLRANTVYTITGAVLIENGGTLNIPAGTRIESEEGAGCYILVKQGGKINVNGTAAAPVVMTADVANAGAGYWGGLVINGRAPLTDGAVGSTEINPEVPYGGNNAADDSGSINYLVLEYTGAAVDADIEHNGLTLNAVGNAHTYKNIYVKDGGDDGIEFFGSTVDVENLLVVNSDDDMFDFTYGYSGTLKNAYGIWAKGYGTEEGDPSGVEADGNLDGKQGLDKTPQSDFTIENLTIDLKLDYAPVAEGVKRYMNTGFMIRRGAKANIVNALITGTGHVKTLVDFANDRGNGNAESVIELTNSLAVPGNGTNPDVVMNPNAAGSQPAPVYSNVDIAAGNTGCDKNLFNWITAAGYALPF
jgi:hypothetical protein